MPPLTPTASCWGARISAASGATAVVMFWRMARRSTSPGETGRTSGSTPCARWSGEYLCLRPGARRLRLRFIHNLPPPLGLLLVLVKILGHNTNFETQALHLDEYASRAEHGRYDCR